MDDEERSALIPKPVSFRFNTATDGPHAIQLLTFLARHLAAAEGGGVLDFVPKGLLSGDKHASCHRPAFMLGEGTHRIRYRGEAFHVTVRAQQGAKEVMVEGLRKAAFMQELLAAAAQHAAQIQVPSQDHYVLEGRRLVLAKGPAPRPLHSLFLTRKDRTALLEAVEAFLENADLYCRCSVPYRLCVVLCGPPGTGKTTAIRTIAAHFRLGLAVIPSSSRLDNDTLLMALRRARATGCRLVALEDVDALLEHGPLTLAGLRQCIDGLLMQEGLILLLTARHLSFEGADLTLHLDSADEYQTRSAFEHFTALIRTPRDAWMRFWDVASRFKYTMGGLQRFLFRAVKEGRLPLEKFQELSGGTPAH